MSAEQKILSLQAGDQTAVEGDRVGIADRDHDIAADLRGMRLNVEKIVPTGNSRQGNDVARSKILDRVLTEAGCKLKGIGAAPAGQAIVAHAAIEHVIAAA